MTNVLVVGYYNHYNLGDEQYKWSIHYILNHLLYRRPQTVEFVDCDKLANHPVPQDSVVLLGGGDVLNTYFLDKINHKFGGMENLGQGVHGGRPKIVAFSVGIPYNSIFLGEENLKKLAIFDHIFLRTRQDIPLFTQFFDPNRVSYLPDASCFLPDAFGPNPAAVSYCTALTTPRPSPSSSDDMYKKLYAALFSLHKTKKIINVNLCRHIYHPLYQENYFSVVRELARFLEDLTKKGYYLVLLPFNTKPSGPGGDETNCENDILIHNDVLRHIKNHSNIINIDYELTLPEILSLYPFFYMSLPMRFHGTLFSIHAAVPMIPIYTTKKIRNILLDIGWTHEYVFEKNEKDLPVSFNPKKMMMTFLGCVRQHTRGKILLTGQFDQFRNYYKSQSAMLESVLFSPSTLTITRSSENDGDTIPPPVPNTGDMYDNYHSPLSTGTTINPLYSAKTVETDDEHIDSIYERLQAFAAENQVDDFRNIVDPVLKNIAVCVVSYFLTGNIDSQYNHGLSEKMFSPSYQYKNEWKWVLQHYRVNGTPPPKLPDNPHGLFNIDYIDQNDQSGAHRSGWAHVFENLIPLHNSEAPLLLDLYVDRTFHWKRDIYKYIGVIPYRKPWIGFIHHTFDESFSEYNNKVLLDCPEFVESLKTCRGIVVLSYYLKCCFDEAFQVRGIQDVPIYVMVHPTEVQVPLFDMAAFLNNPDKKLIHIGGWLRNIFSFYQFDLNPDLVLKKYDMIDPPVRGCVPNLREILRMGRKPTHYRIRKMALKGKLMDNYYPPAQLGDKLAKAFTLLETPGPEGSIEPKFCSQATLSNNWLKHTLDYLVGMVSRMDVKEAVDNNTYDELLTNNLVFLNLVDGSAINTLIECVVRNTPIFINRHPAVVEVLGPHYPLYYTNPSDINVLLENPMCIRHAHEHLMRIRNTPYHIDEFIKNIKSLA
jgi:hypothetical protein